MADLDVVHSTTHYLARDKLYDTEKPFSLRFTAPEDFPRSNIKLEKHDIQVRDIRKSDMLSFQKHGCTVVNLWSKMKHADFDDEELVKKMYLKEVANYLKDFLGAQHVQVFEHTVRKRHEIFPISTGEPYSYNQPTSIAHVDTTVPWALAMARQLNPENADRILKHRVQCVNFWKPLVGPVRDWPLALCLPDGIDPENDLEPCDLVYPDYVVENRQVYHTKGQKWFFLSDQQTHEAWVFLQSDTDSSTRPVAHTAFPLSEGVDSDTPARESIEVRALAYYGGFS